MRARIIWAIASSAALALSCGQDEVTLPDGTSSLAGGACGPWYPGGDAADAGSGDVWGVEEGKIFPCAVWESARLDGADGFVNVGQVFLEDRHGVEETRSMVMVIGARNCPYCASLIAAIVDRADEFDAARAMMIGMARRDQQGSPDDPDLDLDAACQVLEQEGWPMERWWAINDAEHYLPSTFDAGNPWVVVVSVSDMEVRNASSGAFSPNDEGAAALLDFVTGPDFAPAGAR